MIVSAAKPATDRSNRIQRSILEGLYHFLWLLCLLVESVSAYSHWHPEARLMAGILSTAHGDWVRLAAAIATLSLPVLVCVLVARIRSFRWAKGWEIALALIVIPLFLYNVSFIRS